MDPHHNLSSDVSSSSCSVSTFQAALWGRFFYPLVHFHYQGKLHHVGNHFSMETPPINFLVACQPLRRRNVTIIFQGTCQLLGKTGPGHVPPAVELCTHTEQPSQSLTQTKSPPSSMEPTRCLGREDPTVNMSTWHFLSASQGPYRCDCVCTDPSQKSRADQQLLQAGVSTPFLPVTHSWCWPINSTDRRDLTATFTCHLQAHEVLR